MNYDVYTPIQKDKVVIRFDGPPSPDGPRFIEVEVNGESISWGEWIEDGDDWLLVTPVEVCAL